MATHGGIQLDQASERPDLFQELSRVASLLHRWERVDQDMSLLTSTCADRVRPREEISSYNFAYLYRHVPLRFR